MDNKATFDTDVKPDPGKTAGEQLDGKPAATRGAFRVPVGPELGVKIVLGRNEHPVYDAADDGLGFTCEFRCAFTQGQKIAFSLPLGGTVVSGDGEVVHITNAEGRWQYGVRFDALSGEGQALWLEFVKARREDWLNRTS